MNAAEENVPIQALRNLGPKSGEWLRQVGIETVADLRRIGAVAAFQTVREHRDVSWNLLWAMAAGLEEKDWREISEREKQMLHQLLDEL